MRTELAPYACKPQESRGRLVKEPECNTRSPFQRDRDRIIHSTAFRRLEYKTQVFVNHEGDHYRTRLTHSLEVSQIARSLARHLGLNEDLAETVALAHDIGHPPFGHAGEDGLKASMKDFGGFDHNGQALRIVTRLEQRYAEFDGLNLTWETLEGIAKHNGPLIRGIGVGRESGNQGKSTSPTPRVPDSPLPRALAEANQQWDLELHTYASAEAQAAALADDIAYHTHDIDDGLRAKLFTLEDLEEVPEVKAVFESIQKQYPDISLQRLTHEAIRRLINRMCTDLLIQTEANLKRAKIASSQDIRLLGESVVNFSPEMQDINARLKAFLMQHMYKHYKVARMSSKARRVTAALFQFFLSEPECLPTEWQGKTDGMNSQRTAEVVCDYIAGMTDRYALNAYHKIFEVEWFK